MIFAEIIVDISVRSLDRPFQYLVPEELADEAVIGAQVIIPFGQGNRKLTGYIIGLSTTPQYDINRTKSILCVKKESIVAESHLLSLAWWMKENYGSTMNEAIRAVMPVKREIREKTDKRIYPAVTRKELLQARENFNHRNNTARVRLLDELLASENNFEKGIDYRDATGKLKLSAAVIKGLTDRGLITLSSSRIYRNPLENRQREDHRKILNEEQQAVIDTFCNDFEKGYRKTYLIHGITGSGKTEIYMHLIERVLAAGKQAIVLIPEIALTFQTVNRFYSRFGDKVSIMHSRLSAGERYDQFERAKQGEIQIMIGPRSALFTPFSHLGLIVIDEEHETSYRSENPPKYHAREVAVQRAKMLGASVVLGSATPSLEAYYRCTTGEYTLFTLKKRAGGANLPKVFTVDLRQELARKNYSIFSCLLQEKLEERLQKGEQSILFLNRRGYAGFISCRQCGKVISCESCSVSMKPHGYQGKLQILRCHYCGAEKPVPKLCPACGSKYIGSFGLGTEQVVDLAQKRFPTARILRMDADTTSGKEGHAKLLQVFSEGKADILVGTQMIVKGHDFPNVTLVGVLAADLSLNTGNYRAAERTYALLAQASGRAGRGQKPGEVVLQTYQPEHYSITCAARNDYTGFYQQEIVLREILQYPPISNILEVMAFSEKQERGRELLKELKNEADAYSQLTLLGPTDAPIAKLRDVWRSVLYIKSEDYHLLCHIRNQFEAFLRKREDYRDCRLGFDYNF